MKKLLFLSIALLSVLTVKAQVIAFHGGYAFEVDQKMHPDRTNFAIDFYECHGAFGLGVAFPSNYEILDSNLIFTGV